MNPSRHTKRPTRANPPSRGQVPAASPHRPAPCCSIYVCLEVKRKEKKVGKAASATLFTSPLVIIATQERQHILVIEANNHSFYTRTSFQTVKDLQAYQHSLVTEELQPMSEQCHESCFRQRRYDMSSREPSLASSFAEIFPSLPPIKVFLQER